MVRIVSKCASREDFIELFRRFWRDHTLFIATTTPKATGARLGFSITLDGGEPMIRGIGEVVASHATADNPFGRPGMQIRFDETDGPSRQLLDELARHGHTSSDGASRPSENLAAKSKPRAAPPPPIPKIPPPQRSERPPPQQRAVPVPGASSPIKPPAMGSSSPPPAPGDGESAGEADEVDEVDGPATEIDEEVAERAVAAAEVVRAAAPGAAGPGAEASAADDGKPDPVAGGRDAPATQTNAGDEGLATDGERTPGAPTVLPANPFGDVLDDSLEGFVECTIYEETAADQPAEPTGDFEPEEEPPPVAEATPVQTPPPADPPADFPADGGAAPGPVIPPAPDPFSVPAAPALPIEGYAPPPPPAPARLRAPPVSRRALTIAAACLGAVALVAIVFAAVTGESSNEVRAAQDENRADNVAATIPAVAADAGDSAGSSGLDAGRAAPANEEIRPEASDAGADAADGESAAGDLTDATDHSLSETEPPPEAEAEACAATINANPGATVYAAGRRLGATPLDIELPCGEVELSFRQKRHVDEERTVTLEPGEPATVRVRMRRPRYPVQISSWPPGASIYVSGRRVGQTPATIRLPGYAFSRVQVRMRGYETWRQRVFPTEPHTEIRAGLNPRNP